MKQKATDFLKWCNTPIYRASGELGFQKRATPMFPEYTHYLVIDEHGRNIFSSGKFLTAEELYDYYCKTWKRR